MKSIIRELRRTYSFVIIIVRFFIFYKGYFLRILDVYMYVYVYIKKLVIDINYNILVIKSIY